MDDEAFEEVVGLDEEDDSSDAEVQAVIVQQDGFSKHPAVQVQEPPAPICSHLNDLAASIRACAPGGKIDLGGRLVSGALSPGDGDVLTFAKADTQLCNGTLRLTGAQRLVVEAAGVTFEDVTIIDAAAAAGGGATSGGADAGAASVKDLLTVRGWKSTLQLSRCTLSGHLRGEESTLVAVCEGSSLRLQDCKLEGATSIGTLCATSGASQLHATHVKLLGCRRLLKVAEGSVATLAHSSLSRSADELAAVTVTDTGSSATFSACTWGSSVGDGLRVRGGASAVLHACVVAGSRAQSSLRVVGPATSVTATDTRFCDNHGFGVIVTEGAAATLRTCDLTGSVTGGGLAVRGAGSAVVASECKMLANRTVGALVFDKASCELQSCELGAQRSSEALEVMGAGSTAVARDCVLADAGVKVHSGGHALLHRCSLTGFRPSAGLVKGVGSRLEVLFCKLGTCGAFGTSDHGTLEKAQ